MQPASGGNTIVVDGVYAPKCGAPGRLYMTSTRLVFIPKKQGARVLIIPYYRVERVVPMHAERHVALVEIVGGPDPVTKAHALRLGNRYHLRFDRRGDCATIVPYIQDVVQTVPTTRATCILSPAASATPTGGHGSAHVQHCVLPVPYTEGCDLWEVHGRTVNRIAVLLAISKVESKGMKGQFVFPGVDSSIDSTGGDLDDGRRSSDSLTLTDGSLAQHLANVRAQDGLDQLGNLGVDARIQKYDSVADAAGKNGGVAPKGSRESPVRLGDGDGNGRPDHGGSADGLSSWGSAVGPNITPPPGPLTHASSVLDGLDGAAFVGGVSETVHAPKGGANADDVAGPVLDERRGSRAASSAQRLPASSLDVVGELAAAENENAVSLNAVGSGVGDEAARNGSSAGAALLGAVVMKSHKPTKREALLRRLFPAHVAADEKCYGCVMCAVSAKILIQGRLFVTDRALYFYSNIFGSRTRRVVPFSTIGALSRMNSQLPIGKRVLNTGLATGIQVEYYKTERQCLSSSSDRQGTSISEEVAMETMHLSSFLRPKRMYELVNALWDKAKERLSASYESMLGSSSGSVALVRSMSEGLLEEDSGSLHQFAFGAPTGPAANSSLTGYDAVLDAVDDDDDDDDDVVDDVVDDDHDDDDADVVDGFGSLESDDEDDVWGPRRRASLASGNMALPRVKISSSRSGGVDLSSAGRPRHLFGHGANRAAKRLSSADALPGGVVGDPGTPRFPPVREHVGVDVATWTLPKRSTYWKVVRTMWAERVWKHWLRSLAGYDIDMSSWMVGLTHGLVPVRGDQRRIECALVAPLMGFSPVYLCMEQEVSEVSYSVFGLTMKCELYGAESDDSGSGLDGESEGEGDENGFSSSSDSVSGGHAGDRVLYGSVIVELTLYRERPLKIVVSKRRLDKGGSEKSANAIASMSHFVRDLFKALWCTVTGRPLPPDPSRSTLAPENGYPSDEESSWEEEYEVDRQDVDVSSGSAVEQSDESSGEHGAHHELDRMPCMLSESSSDDAISLVPPTLHNHVSLGSVMKSASGEVCVGHFPISWISTANAAPIGNILANYRIAGPPGRVRARLMQASAQHVRSVKRAIDVLPDTIRRQVGLLDEPLPSHGIPPATRNFYLFVLVTLCIVLVLANRSAVPKAFHGYTGLLFGRSAQR